MKVFFSTILSIIVFFASFQNSLVLLDYNIHREFYEAHCVNKGKPEMECHGKCEMKKQAEKSNSPFNIVKTGAFDFHFVPNALVEIPNLQKDFHNNHQKIFHTNFHQILKGYHQILPHPPQV